jgi:ubiquinol-cytochrome c reductase cytochrome b subunit
VNEEARAVLEAKTVPALMPAPGSEDVNGVPAPSSRGALGKVRARANRAFAETIVVGTNGHGNGHEVGNGHGAAVEAGQTGEQASVRSAAAGELPAGENPEGSPGS